MFGFGTQTSAGPRDPSRIALAQAISERDQMAERLEFAKAAAAKMGEALSDATARLAAVKSAASAAAEERVERLLSGQTATIERPDRAAEQDAESDIAAARSALAKVEARIAEYDDAHQRAERRVEAAIGAVIEGAIDEVIGEVEALRHDLASRLAVLRLLARATPIGSARGRRANLTLGDATTDSNHPALMPWRIALQALTRDPDAPLP